MNFPMSPGDCNLVVCCRVKQDENSGVRVFYLLSEKDKKKKMGAYTEICKKKK